MPLWKMEQIDPYYEKDHERNHTKRNPLGAKLVKDCLTNSEIGVIHFLEEGVSYNDEKITTSTIICSTIATHDVYRDENPSLNSYEKAAKALYKIYWGNLSCWGKLHRVCYKWSLPAIAGSLFLLFGEAIVPYLWDVPAVIDVEAGQISCHISK